MTTNIREVLSELLDDALFLDEPEYDAAIIGIASRCSESYAVAYSVEKILEILVGMGMEYEDAADFFAYNIEGAWVGERTPIFISSFGIN